MIYTEGWGSYGDNVTPPIGLTHGRSVLLDLHSLVQLPPEESRDTDRKHWGGLQERTEAHAAPGGYIR